MTPGAEAMLRALVGVCSQSDAPELAPLIVAVLVADGLPPEPVTQASRSSGAIRQARYRDRNALRNTVTSPVTSREGGVGGGVGSDPAEDTQSDHPQVGDPGEGDVTRYASRDVTPPARNAMDDGCFGMTISAWCDGIRIATGHPCTPPVQGAVRQLVHCLGAHRPTPCPDPVDWARTVAGEYVRMNPASQWSAFGFVRWMDAGRPPPKLPAGRQDAPPGAPPYLRSDNPNETPAVLEERRSRRAREREAEAGAVKMPDALRLLLGMNGAGKPTEASQTPSPDEPVWRDDEQ